MLSTEPGNCNFPGFVFKEDIHEAITRNITIHITFKRL